MEVDASEHFKSANLRSEVGGWGGRIVCPACVGAGVACRAHARIHMYHQGCEFVEPQDGEQHGMRLTQAAAGGPERSDP